jgi:DNA helicase-2/ATP-dependent DNA helicase PcrA
VVSALADPQSAAHMVKAYLAWRQKEEETVPNEELARQAAQWLTKCTAVESFVSPRTDRDWLATLPSASDGGKGASEEVRQELEAFRIILRRWQATTLLPIDQMILTLGQDLFTAPNDLALAHKLALVLQQVSRDHADWRLPELNGELSLIARNERRFLGFSEGDAGFNPSHYAGKVVVTTMHKAKGLEWDRVYLMSVNNYDFPSLQANDRYISEKWFVRDALNLEAETLAQLQAVITNNEYAWYEPGQATGKARLDYVRERLRLLYVGITRAKKELVMTWNTGRTGEQTQALPFSAMQGWLELSTNH